METVRSCAHSADSPSIFYQSLAATVKPGATIAVKAADQLQNLSYLKQFAPSTCALAIVRDGRDATISAGHYEALMREQQAPWQVPSTAGWRRLLGWSVRAAKLAEHARRGDVLVVRYEDLIEDFEGVFRRLFRVLELDTDHQLLASIKRTTDFETLKSNDGKGSTPPHNIRQGTVGEWKNVLTRSQAQRSWAIAGVSLQAFGYTKTGDLKESSLVLKPTAH